MNTFNVGALIRSAWSDYKQYWKTFLLIFLLMALVSFSASAGSSFDPMNEIVNQDGMAIIFSVLASTWLGIGYLNFLLNIVDGNQARFRDIFYGVKSAEQFAYYILVSIVYAALIFLGLVLLIIPGIILGIGFFFVKYYIAENRLGFEEAFRSSWSITKGNRWKMLWLGIVLGFLNLLGFLVVGVGLLVTIPVSQLAYTRLFRQLEGIPLPDAGGEPEEEVFEEIEEE
jgi:hypothetical protein